MLFKELAEIFEQIEKTSERLVMSALIAQIYKSAEPTEAKKITYLLQGILAPPYENIELGMGEKFAEQAIAQSTGYLKKEIEKEYKKLGDLGLVVQFFLGRKKQSVLSTKNMNVSYVYDALIKIAKTSGIRSQSMKIKLLSELLNNSSPVEGKSILRFVVGQMRLGVGDSTILDGLSIAKTGDKQLREELERAYNLCSDLGLVAEIFINSPEKTKDFKIKIFKPLRPALAERLSTPEEIVKKIGKCSIEYKFDGFRMQIHKKNNIVEVFSRKLEKITHMFPEIVETTKKLKAEEIIFEGEALAYNKKKNYFYSFQETMHRRRKHGIKDSVKEYPLLLYVFDLIYLDGKDFTQKPYKERRKNIEKIFPFGQLKVAKKRITKKPEQIRKIFEESIKHGLEGIMAKDLNAPYVAGARKFAWIKMKKSYGKIVDTIDAVIVGYYFGKGARVEFEFGGLLVAVYNTEQEKFETIAKVGSGYSEEEMKDLEKMLSKIKTLKPPFNLNWKLAPDFWVVPKYVVEIAFDDITLSSIHTCGMINERGYALRFPRMVKLRMDKSQNESTTVQEIIAMYNKMNSAKL